MQDAHTSKATEFEVVVSHFGSRDFELLIPLIPEAHFLVYDKSGVYGGECVRIPNEGREGSTYLGHMVANYDGLAARTLFMQDDLLNHRTNLIDFVAEVLGGGEFVQYPCTWARGRESYRRTVVDGVCDLWTMGSSDAVGRACGELGIKLPREYTTETCAFFSVSRGRVHARPKEFYARARRWVLESEANEYALEHMWRIIFG